MDGCIPRDGREGEFLDDSVQWKNLLPGRRGPAQKNKVVQKSLWQESLVSILGNGGSPMTFAQGRAVRTQDEGMMGKNGRLPAQSLKEENLARCIGKVVVSSNHMADMHQMVIDDAGKIISRHSIGPDDDEIAYPFSIEGHPPVNEIFKGDCSPPHMESKDRRLAFRFPLRNFSL
jgi:hypothetical protein